MDAVCMQNMHCKHYSKTDQKEAVFTTRESITNELVVMYGVSISGGFCYLYRRVTPCSEFAGPST